MTATSRMTGLTAGTLRAWERRHGAVEPSRDAAGRRVYDAAMIERLTRLQAFAAFTTGAAFANFAEARTGTLEPGKWADFILVDRDIFTIPAADLWRVKVGETWVGGRRVFSASPQSTVRR